jgi:hypothetical protein
MDYRTLTLVTLAVVIVAIVLHWLVIGRRSGHPGVSVGPRPPLRLGERVLYTLMLLGTAALAGTSATATLGMTPRMHGRALIAHASVGLAFAVVLALLMLLWAERNGGRSPEQGVPQFGPGQRCAFWLMSLAGLATTLTIVLMMLPAFSEAGQHWLLDAHRISALTLLVLVLVHAYLMLCARATRRGAVTTQSAQTE